jgi:hypothetical protein
MQHPVLQLFYLVIERTIPLYFGLYRLVTPFGQALHPDGHIPFMRIAWYHKQGYLTI